MPYEMQVKLLRVLQERTFERVGGGKAIKCNVRVIAATHQQLEQHVEDGKFRMDLYYRLNVFPLDVPPLRDRTSDIAGLAQRFIDSFAGRAAALFGWKLTPCSTCGFTAGQAMFGSWVI